MEKQKKLSISEVKEIELGLLLKFDQICQRHGLTYYLCGGTLLGAIHHKGFIPWDDDIDVLMPRGDFEKLLELEKTQDSTEIEQIVSWKSGKSIYPFIKLINTNTVLKEKYLSEEFTTGVWIDIFPFDGMPDDDRLIAKKFKKIKFYKTILLTAYSEQGTGASKIATAVKMILIPLCKHINTTRLCDKLNTISKEYPIEDSPYVGGFLWGYGPKKKGHGPFWNLLKWNLKDINFLPQKKRGYFMILTHG